MVGYPIKYFVLFTDHEASDRFFLMLLGSQIWVLCQEVNHIVNPLDKLIGCG